MKKREWKTCGKKIRYRDEHSANQYKKKCERERNVKLDYYWCPYCKGYHLTSICTDSLDLVKGFDKCLKESFAMELAI